MNKYLRTLFFLFALYSCSKPEVKIPDGILSKSQMVVLVTDVQIAQAAVANYSMADSTKSSMTILIPEILLNRHVTSAQYDSSFTFYSQHPELMSGIYEGVITELSKKQSEVQSH